MEYSNQEKPKLRREVVRRTVELMLAGFALVAALAWNDAIQTLFGEIFGAQGSIMAKFLYALVVTIIVTLVAIHLGKYVGGEK